MQTTVRTGSGVFDKSYQAVYGFQITGGALARHGEVDNPRDDRISPPFLPSRDIGKVDLGSWTGDDLQRVTYGKTVVCPSPRVHEKRRGISMFVQVFDIYALMIRLHAEARPSQSLALLPARSFEFPKGDGAIVLYRAFSQHVEVHSV